jgi:glutamate-1-semialdehyde aminotransferase
MKSDLSYDVWTSITDRLLGDTEAYDPVESRSMVFESASGATITDPQGNNYLDLINGGGQITLGHAFPALAEAIAEAARRLGGCCTGPATDVADVIDLLALHLPREFKYAFMLSGTEAMLAVAHSYADKATRPYIVNSGYHGWSPLWKPALPLGEPNPHSVIDVFFDLNLFEDTIRRYKDKIGLICISPDHTWLAPSYYQDFFALAQKTGAVICCDDIKQGYRKHPGCSLPGFLDHFDAVVYGKGISNGNRISAIAARPEKFPHLNEINSTSAFESTAFAAARATLSTYEQRPVHSQMLAWGDNFVTKMKEALLELQIPVEIVGSGSTWQFVFPGDEIEELFVKLCFQEGVLTVPLDTLKPSFAFTPEVYDSLLQRLRRAFQQLKGHMSSKGYTALDNERRVISSLFVLHGVPPGLVPDPFLYVESHLIRH